MKEANEEILAWVKRERRRKWNVGMNTIMDDKKRNDGWNEENDEKK